MTIVQRRPMFKLLIWIGLLSGLLLGCVSETTTKVKYSVSFETNGGSEVTAIEVENGRKIPTDIAEPTKDNDSEFVGWYKDNETFLIPWNFDTDIVTQNVTLYAKWIKSEPFPTEIALTEEPFSATLSWIQTGIDMTTQYTVTFYAGTLATRQETQLDSDGAEITVTIEYYEYATEGIVIAGTHQVSGENHVQWTPTVLPQGGVYQLIVLTDGAHSVTIPEVYMKGEGTDSNPYLLYGASDLIAIANTDNVGLGKFYKVAHDFSHEVVYAEIEGNTFEGTLNGNGKVITLTGNAGMFYELGVQGTVTNLTVSGSITTASIASIGAYAIINRGSIVNSTSRAALTSSAGIVGDPDTKLLGGAGGFVGINESTGTISDSRFIGTSSSDGVIKALIGGGGIASINYGVIEDCENRGTLGAYNSVESGKSMSNYSYMGGIAGFNYGTIRRSATTSTGKLLAQRYYNNGSPTDTSNNRVIGGIVGYNASTGIVDQSFFNGIRVHGDQYVGGIAGINAGLISNSYAEGRYYSTPKARSYVGGRLQVGGIAGALEEGGVITNCYNTANVYAYEGIAYAIAERATNSVYITVNHDARATGTQTYGNTPSDSLTAPTGNGNIGITNQPLVSGDGIRYALSPTYQPTLGAYFAVIGGETLLAWQSTEE
jgi:uncharacterized repeat protein (TIGR02543 family)